jgi:hypothetical protein
MVIRKISHRATNTCDDNTVPTMFNLQPPKIGKEKTSSKTYRIAVAITRAPASFRRIGIWSRNTSGIGMTTMAKSLRTFNRAAQAYHV